MSKAMTQAIHYLLKIDATTVGLLSMLLAVVIAGLIVIGWIVIWYYYRVTKNIRSARQ